jgi:hypothetical protein
MIEVDLIEAVKEKWEKIDIEKINQIIMTMPD